MEQIVISWVLLAAIGGAVLTALGAFSKSSATRKTLFMWGLPILGVGLLLTVSPGILPDNLSWLSGPLRGENAGDVLGGTFLVNTVGNQGGNVLNCGVEDTTVTLSAVNKYTSAATSGTHRYRVNGNPALTVADAGTLTASPGDTISVLWENEAAASTYFGSVDEYTVPCAGTATFSKELLQNGSVSISVFNEEGNLINGVDNETLGAGDTVSLKFDINAQNQKGFPYGGVLIVEFNNDTAYDEENTAISIAGLGGSLKKVSTPGVHTVSGVNNKVVTFEVPSFESSNKYSGTLFIDVDNNINPSTTNDITVTFRPYDFYVNEDKGGAFEGPAVEDEDSAATYGHATSSTVHVQ
jgi:hypothetical protein